MLAVDLELAILLDSIKAFLYIKLLINKEASMKKPLITVFSLFILTVAAVLVFLPIENKKIHKLNPLPYNEEKYTRLLKEGDNQFDKMHLHGWRKAIDAYYTAFRMKQTQPLRDRLFMTLALTAMREKDQHILQPATYEKLDTLNVEADSLSPKQQYLFRMLTHYRTAPFPDDRQVTIRAPYIDYVEPSHFDLKNSALDLYLYLYLLQYYTFESGRHDDRMFQIYRDLDIQGQMEKFKDHPLMIYLNFTIPRGNEERVEELYPEFAEYYLFRANAFFRNRRLTNAFRYYRKAYKLIPDYTGALNGIANIYYFTVRNYERAIQFYQKTLLLDPENTVALFGKGVSLHHLEQYAASNKVLDFMLENQHRHHGEAYYYKAYNYFLTEEFGLARGLLEKAKELLPGKGEVFALSGQLYLKEKAPPRAELDFIKALADNDIPHSLVLHNLGMIHLRIKSWLFFDYFDQSIAAFNRQRGNMKQEIRNIDNLDIGSQIKQWMKQDRQKKFFDFDQQAQFLIRKMRQISAVNKRNRPTRSLELDDRMPQNHGNHPLHMAAVAGEVDTINRLLEEGVFIDIRNKIGYTPLYYAAMMGKTAAVKGLIRKGANVNITMPSGYTPLHEAAYAGHKEIVELLIGHGADLFARDKLNYTPVRTAGEKHAALAPLLAPLHRKVEANYIEATKSFLQKHTGPGIPGLIDTRDHLGRTPLFLAAADGNLDMAKMLLQRGADPNITDKKGFSPFLMAKKNEDKEMQLLLSTNGAKFTPMDHMQGKSLEEKHAQIWFAHRNTWLIRTANHVLLFNHLPGAFQVGQRIGSHFSNGVDINSSILRGFNLVHCLTHMPQWYRSFSNLYTWSAGLTKNSVITAWGAPKPEGWLARRNTQMQTWPGQAFNIEGVDIRTVQVSGGNAAYWLKTDGLVVFYASHDFLDHEQKNDPTNKNRTNKNRTNNNRTGTGNETMENWFQRNYQPVKSWGPVDIVILPVPGNASHPQTQRIIAFLETVKPRVMFPLYEGTAEHYYARFAGEIKRHGIKTKILYPQHKGHHFNY